MVAIQMALSGEIYAVMEEDEMGRAVWTWDVEEIPVELDQTEFTTDENGRAEI